MLHSVDHARRLQAELPDEGRIGLIGAGYIGIELADAFTHRGLQVELFEAMPSVLTTLDAELGATVAVELGVHGVHVHADTMVTRIEQREAGLAIVASSGVAVDVDAVVIAVGVAPEASLLAAAGVQVDERGAAIVDDRMRTNLPDVFAAGDCVQTRHVLLDEPSYLPLGTAAHKQGRIAGIQAVGGSAVYPGTCGTQAVKIFNLVAVRTGLREHEARSAGWAPRSIDVTVDDHKGYYPGATPIRIRLTGDTPSRRVLGAQIIGAYGAEVSKRAVQRT